MNVIHMSTYVYKHRYTYMYVYKNIYGILSKCLFPKSAINRVYIHGAPLLTAFISKVLSKHMLNQHKVHSSANVSSAGHFQSLDVGEELLLSVAFAFSKIQPAFC